MDRKKRTLLQVKIADDDRKDTAKSVERLMGNKAEARFEFIQERAEFAERRDAGRLAPRFDASLHSRLICPILRPPGASRSMGSV